MTVHTFGPFWGVMARVLPLSDVWAPGFAESLGLSGEGLYVTLLDGARAVPFCWAPSSGWAEALREPGAPTRALGDRPFRAMVSRLRDGAVGPGLLEGALRSCLGDPSSLLLSLEVMAS